MNFPGWSSLSKAMLGINMNFSLCSFAPSPINGCSSFHWYFPASIVHSKTEGRKTKENKRYIFTSMSIKTRTMRKKYIPIVVVTNLVQLNRKRAFILRDIYPLALSNGCLQSTCHGFSSICKREEKSPYYINVDVVDLFFFHKLLATSNYC